ncbi:MAG: hypothetical protein WBP71_10660 [Terracidiphilus sp.]
MKSMNSREMHRTLHRALEEVDRRLAPGELDGSGRFSTDEELAQGAATGKLTRKSQANPRAKSEDPAA